MIPTGGSECLNGTGTLLEIEFKIGVLLLQNGQTTLFTSETVF